MGNCLFSLCLHDETIDVNSLHEFEYLSSLEKPPDIRRHVLNSQILETI